MLPLRQLRAWLTRGGALCSRRTRHARTLGSAPFLEALFEHLPLAVAIVNEEDRIIAVNPAFSELFGFSAAEAQGKPIGDLIVPEELRAEGQHFTETVLHGTPISTETVRQHRSGERIPVWLRAVPISTVGKRLGVLALYHDIRPLHEHRQQLSHLVQQLQQLNATKDRLLALIAHDLRSPLAAAQGLVELIRAEAHTPDSVLEHAAKLHKLLAEPLELTNELLELARTEGGHATLELSELDLCEVLVNAIDTVTLAAYSKQIRLAVHLPEEGIAMRGDAQKLFRIFQNLLSNAIKFTPAGGTVELLAQQEPDSSILVRISDTGIGIPPEQLPHLFEPFALLQRRGTHGEGGTGLGLSIVKRFVELHGGQISVESTPNCGTTFLLRFPAAPPGS